MPVPIPSPVPIIIPVAEAVVVAFPEAIIVALIMAATSLIGTLAGAFVLYKKSASKIEQIHIIVNSQKQEMIREISMLKGYILKAEGVVLPTEDIAKGDQDASPSLPT